MQLSWSLECSSTVIGVKEVFRKALTLKSCFCWRKIISLVTIAGKSWLSLVLLAQCCEYDQKL